MGGEWTIKNNFGTIQPLQEASPTLTDKASLKPETDIGLLSYKFSETSGAKNGETTKPDWKHFSKRFFPREINEVILEWWIGEVNKVHNDYFTAYMIDLGGREIGAEFDMRSVDPSSRYLVKPQAQFAYYVSRLDSYKGRRTSSALVFSKPLHLLFGSREALLKKAEELFEPEPDFDKE